MQDDNRVLWCDRTDVMSRSNGAGDGTSLVGTVGKSLAAEEGSAALRNLKDDRRLGIASCFQRCDDGRGGGDIDSGDGELVLPGVLEQSKDVIADDDAGLAGEDVGNTHVCEMCV